MSRKNHNQSNAAKPPVAAPETILDKLEEDIVLNGEAGAEDRAKNIVREDLTRKLGLPPAWGEVTVRQTGRTA